MPFAILFRRSSFFRASRSYQSCRIAQRYCSITQQTVKDHEVRDVDNHVVNRWNEAISLVEQKKILVPKFPLVFCHGLFGFDHISFPFGYKFYYWRNIYPLLKSHGAEVYICKVPRASSIETRAAALKSFVFERVINEAPHQSVNLIGHSMGGIDARYFCSQLEGDKVVSSIVTLSSPHRGSPMADWVVGNSEKLGELASSMLIETMPAVVQLTTKSMREFNKREAGNGDSREEGGEVELYSFGSYVEGEHLIWPQRIAHGVIERREGANDSLVSVESARWGTYVKTLQAEHLELINYQHRTINKPASITFNANQFFLTLITFLSLSGH